VRADAVRRVAVDAALTLGIGGLLAAVAFTAQGGLLLGRTTKTELVLLIGSGLVVAASALAAPAHGRLHGARTAGLFLALGLFTVASVAWAVQPSDAWVEANRTLTYAAVFAATIATVRALPDRWGAVLGGVALAGLVVSGYALATKVFPGALDPDAIYARLRPPFGYWNSVGLTAALATPAFLWLGARRHGHPLVNVAAYPALGVLFVVVMLSYSRGALLALLLGVAFWFAVVPLRLRGAAVFGVAAAGAALVVLWAFSQDALTLDRLPLDVRVDAGHQLGLLVLGMMLGLTAAGLLISFGAATRPLGPSGRRNAGIAVLCALALVPVGAAIGLAQTERGLFGSIDHGVSELVDPKASSPSNDPSRLTSAGSVRARYWKEALQAFGDHPWVGVGAHGYATVRPLYREDQLDVLHAHGYVVQTLADLGLIGMALSLLALLAWAVAAARATGLRRADRAEPFTPERIGLLTMVAVVVIFGVHSFVDWTWFVPGNALVAVVCAGWVVGRGPLSAQGAAAAPRLAAPRAWLADRGRVLAAGAAVVTALLVAWAAWQPLRSLDASNDGLAALERGDLKTARAHAESARDRNPLALDPLTVLAIVETRERDKQAALRALQEEVRLQPANHEVWLRLADFQLNQLKRPKDALRSLAAALYLDPRDPLTIGAYLEVSRKVTGRTPKVAPPPPPEPGQAQPGQPAVPGQPAPANPSGTN
jgi:tetratricopeptide (TPR) repeat protein